MKNTSFLRLLQVERVLQDAAVSRWFPEISRPLAARAVAAVLENFRAAIKKGQDAPSGEKVIEDCAAVCRRLSAFRLQRVVNATGVILPADLGRSPLAAAAAERMVEFSTGYCNLEFDLETGQRGRRGGLTRELLALLTGAPDALVVNNNAAALLLSLSCLAAGREVVISRGELIQIGDGFRIPEILALSGARLREIGTTNVSTLPDYLGAIGPDTAAVLVVHSSDFKMCGFSSQPSVKELAAALPAGLALLVDQGSGALDEGVPGEIPVKRHIQDGAQLVCFSGDKLLGGPQAGIIAGTRECLARLSVHPLMRALRPGKNVLAALEAVAVHRLNGEDRGRAYELLESGQTSLSVLRRRGRNILRGISKEAAELVDSTAQFGGGISPDEERPSLSIELRDPRSASVLVEALRRESPPLIAVIEADRPRLNLASIAPGEDRLVREALQRLLRTIENSSEPAEV